MQPRIVVTGRIPEPGIELLRAHGDVELADGEQPLPRNELLEMVGGADAIVALLSDSIDGELLDAAGPQLRCVANVAVGYDNIDVAAAASRGVVVTNTPGVLTDATADLAMALILAVTRRVVEGDRLLRSGSGGSWAWGMFFMLGTSLAGKTLGIVGLGAIGQATARRARAFGMKVAYAGPRRAAPEVEESLGRADYLQLDELLARSDIVSLHCPLTPETRHLIDADRLRRMRPEAFLVNTARGSIVDEPALVQALREGVIAGAALDVFEHEPRVHAELPGLENVVLVPHLGSATVETRTEMALLAARNVVAVLRGEPALTPVVPR